MGSENKTYLQLEWPVVLRFFRALSGSRLQITGPPYAGKKQGTKVSDAITALVTAVVTSVTFDADHVKGSPKMLGSELLLSNSDLKDGLPLPPLDAATLSSAMAAALPSGPNPSLPVSAEAQEDVRMGLHRAHASQV